jgi:glutamate dehydrogenase
VDTSDHEVNRKILVSGPVRRGEITMEQRDVDLMAVTDEVAAHVLKDNYDQTLALSVAQQFATRDLDAYGRFMRDLERRGKLDRAVEFLPDEEELRKRAQAGKGLTRPELSVMLAYAKLDLFAEIIGTDLPDDPHFLSTLAGYFPDATAKAFPNEVEHHRLRREIIATVLANRIVNLGGPVFVHRLNESSGANHARIARAFVVADGGFGLSALKARIDALDAKVEANVQTSMYADITEVLRRLGLWFLANIPADADLNDSIAMYRAGVEALRGTFATLVSPYEAANTEERIKLLQDAGAPLDVAEDVAVLGLLSAAPEIAQLAHTRSVDIDLVAGAYFEVGALGSPRDPAHRRRSLRWTARPHREGAGAVRARAGGPHARRRHRGGKALGGEERRRAGADQGVLRRTGTHRRSDDGEVDTGQFAGARAGGKVGSVS